jgi:16S rRNA (cytosine967-C5)-methyltransferase
MNARDTALAALLACRRQNAWSDGVLKEYIRRDGLDRRDAALASRLCYGVLQNRMLLDFYVQSFLRGKLKSLQPVVLDILRLGAYQIAFMDKIPASAAVNSAVEQTKKHANPRAAGLVNGVLRAMARAEKLPEPSDLETCYSHPAALTALLREAVGDAELETLLRADNSVPETAVQVNTLRTTVAEAEAALIACGASCRRHPLAEDCLLVSGTGSVELLEPFRMGWVYVQDAGAHLAALSAGLAPGMTVLDACAAPGGKSFAAAIAMHDTGTILSCDLHPHKIKLIELGAERLGLTCIEAQQRDASVFEPKWEEKFDAVIADVPCSGLGVIRKKPDIRYKDLSQLENLPTVQLRILNNVSRYVRPGGVLLYSTCTLLPRENQGVVTQFLQEHPEFSPEQLPLPLEEDATGMVTLWPHRHETDGFFICRLRRNV